MRSLTFVLALAACGGDKETVPDTDGTTPPSETGTTPTGDTAPPPGPDMVVLAEHSYALTTAWTIATTSTRAGQDATVGWSGVEVDAWGAPMLPSEVPKLVLFEIVLAPADVPARLAADDLGNTLVSVWEGDVDGLVFQNLEDLFYETTPFSAPALWIETNGKTWMLALATWDGARYDIRAAHLVTPEDGGGTTTITMAEGDSSFTWSAALSGTPLVTSQGFEVYTFDWSEIGNDAFGKEYDDAKGDVLFIGRFDEAATELGASAVDLSTVAEGWWTMDVERDEEARVDLARDSGGTSFPGFTAGSTWVVGVKCSTCLSPFPLWATVVEVQ